MKASELRIGNYYQWDGEGKFLQIGVEQLSKMLIGTTRIKPIQLTEEILLKCGFKLYPSGSYCIDLFDKDNYLAIDIKYNKGFIYINVDDTSLKIESKYLHQLQNLYFALTNNELNIEL